MTAQRILLRRDTATNWTVANPVLLLGEEAIETDTLRRKIGDGATAWNGLAYAVALPGDVSAAQAAAQAHADTAVAGEVTRADGKYVAAAGLDAATAAAITPGGSATAAAIAADPAVKAAYGTVDVIAPAPTGVAATDTANLQAAINRTPVGGHLHIPGDDTGGTGYVINAALTINQPITITGQSIGETYGSSFDTPDPPYVRGTVIKQTTAGANILEFGLSVSPQIYRLGLTFDTAIAGNTGHGVYSNPAANSSGLLGFMFEDVIVAGHDGNHYAFYLNNPMHGSLTRLRGYGGGGLFIGCNSTSGNYGNIVAIQPTFMVWNDGTAHGYAHSSLASSGATGVLNLITYIRPQCNVSTAVANGQATWNDFLGAGRPLNIVVLAPDLENAPGAAQEFNNGPNTQFIGGDQLNRGDVNNTFFGIGALAYPAGGSNSAFGKQTLETCTTGNNNAAVGYQALQALTDSRNCTAVGSQALAGADNHDNTGVGFQALMNQAGWRNTALGSSAGPSTSRRDYTVSIGYGVIADASGAVAIGVDSTGASATATTTDTFVLGTPNHTVQAPGRLNVARRTPTSSADTQGSVGDITTDDSYVYVKTSTGWKRAALTTF